MELFAGIGSWAKSLSNLQIKNVVVDAIEIDDKTVRSYNLLHNTNFVNRDIKDIDENIYKDIDLICYSPPCQSWSRVGKKQGFKDERGMLFYEALRIIKKVQPKFAVMENVKHLTSSDFKDDFNIMLKELENAGYRNYWKVVNGLDVNFPQYRTRVFVVSIRKDIEMEYVFPEKQELTRSFVEFLEDDWDKKYLHSDKGIKFMDSKSTKGRTRWDFGEHNDTDNQYIHCITKNYSKGVPHNVLIDRRKEIYVRRFTSLEVMRLMGYEDNDWQALKNGKISDSLIYEMAGNSIIVPVVEAILKNLLIKETK